jgi:hypothetical protein
MHLFAVNNNGIGVYLYRSATTGAFLLSTKLSVPFVRICFFKVAVAVQQNKGFPYSI